MRGNLQRLLTDADYGMKAEMKDVGKEVLFVVSDPQAPDQISMESVVRLECCFMAASGKSLIPPCLLDIQVAQARCDRGVTRK